MENKKLGILLIVISLLIGGMFMYLVDSLVDKSDKIGCFNNPNCIEIERKLSVSHFAIGIFAFVFALGFYLLFFNKTDKIILEKLENEKKESIENGKFDFALKFLDPSEARVLKKVKEQEGITQSTLRIKTDMSKAKLSYILQDLEKRNLIKRVRKGKTMQIFLKL